MKFAIDNFAFGDEPFMVEPIEGVVLRKRLTPGKNNIYSLNGKVYKLYDTLTKSYAKPNVEIIKQTLGEDYLPGINVVNLANGERCKCLTYGYINEKKSAYVSLEDFKPIMKDLDKLHKENYVHSDVRFCNMVFPEKSDAKLIDFDLMDKVDTKYPVGYNSRLSERHSDAKAGLARRIIHDRYSLVRVILDTVVEIADENKEQLRTFQVNESPTLETFFN